MYIWGTDKLTRQLREGKTTTISRISYLFVFVVQYATGLLVFQAVPTIYRLAFDYAKEHIEAQAGHPSLKITVYHSAPEWFWWALGTVIAVGLLACWLAHCTQGVHRFIDRFICLNTPISTRILFVTLLFFGLGLLFGALHFTGKLHSLLQPVKSPRMGLDPVKFLWKTLTKVTGLKLIFKNLALLERAQAIFKEINQFSFLMYRISYWTALGSVICYFWKMQRHLQCMRSKE